MCSDFQDGGPPVPGSTKGYAASYMMRAMLIGISLGVQRIWWYNYQDNWFDRSDGEANFGSSVFPIWINFRIADDYDRHPRLFWLSGANVCNALCAADLLWCAVVS